jgi:hypothetical protein
VKLSDPSPRSTRDNIKGPASCVLLETISEVLHHNTGELDFGSRVGLNSSSVAAGVSFAIVW